MLLRIPRLYRDLDFRDRTGEGLRTSDGKQIDRERIVARSVEGQAEAIACLDRYEDRLTRSLAQIINILDPELIVLGGGMSRVHRLYENVPYRLKEYVFGREAETAVLVAKHGDASGVRG